MEIEKSGLGKLRPDAITISFGWILGLPLICAGGIGNKDQLASVMDIGYDGVQMGTRFIATLECNTPEDYKEAIVKASEKDIVSTTRMTGKPISIIRSIDHKDENSWLIQKLLNSRFKHQTRMLLNLNSLIRLKYLLRKNSSKNIQKNKKYYSAGKSAHTVTNIESATTIMRRLGQSLDKKDKKMQV